MPHKDCAGDYCSKNLAEGTEGRVPCASKVCPLGLVGQVVTLVQRARPVHLGPTCLFSILRVLSGISSFV